MSDKGRILWVDLVRAAGMILIFWGHSLYSQTGNAGILIYEVNVPVFFILSGYLFHEQPVFKQMVKLFYNLIVPYVVTCFIMVLLSLIKNHFPNIILLKSMGPVKADLMTSFWGIGTRGRLAFSNYVANPIGAIWFLLALFWCSILFNVLIKLLKKLNYFYISMTVISLCIMLASFWMANAFAIFPWSLNAALIGVIFMWGGYILRKLDIIHKSNTQKLIVLLLALMMWGLALIFKVHFWFNFAITNNVPIAIISAFGGSIVLILIAVWVEELFSKLQLIKWIALFGKYSLVALCIDSIDGNVLFINQHIISRIPNVESIVVLEELIYLISLPVISMVILRKIPFLRSCYFNREFGFPWQWGRN